MESVKVTILGRQYPLKVDESEVQTIQKIARFVDEKFRLYKRELTNQPETTVMVLAALSIAEELFETRQKANDSLAGESDIMENINQSLENLLKEIE